MNCALCNTGKMKKEKIRNYRYVESGLDSVVLKDIPIDRCMNCGSDIVGIVNISGLHAAISKALISKPAKLTPKEIRFLRKFIGWSASDFARKFHTSPQTVSRWESEKNRAGMDKRAELLLRMTVALGQRIKNYKDHLEEYAAQETIDPISLTLTLEKGSWNLAA